MPEANKYKNKFLKLLFLYFIYSIKEITKKLFKAFNYTIIHDSIYKRFVEKSASTRDIIFLYNLKNKKLNKYLTESKSELRQDLFVLNELKFKKNGFFVEFGAGNGVDSSNTYLLEKKFNWNGIISEPAKIFEKQLKKVRKCQINYDAIYSKDYALITFNENNLIPTMK
jgi:hypothetical protein